jgi:catechol 2,3-dioxygenase-like lactoylglutathione lyase family enzyme
MPDLPAPLLEAAVPILPVSDLAASIEYYDTVLGFSLGWKSGDPPRLASVCRDRVEFNLALRDSSTQAQVGKVYVHVSGIDRYYAQITQAGATVTVPLAARAYGMKDCRIVDPDGNELSFGEVTACE